MNFYDDNYLESNMYDYYTDKQILDKLKKLAGDHFSCPYCKTIFSLNSKDNKELYDKAMKDKSIRKLCPVCEKEFEIIKGY